MLRFGAFLFAFFILPHTVEDTIDKFTAKMKPSKILGPAKNIGYVGKLISSVIFCGSIPSIVNIFLTRQRVERDKQLGAEKQQQGIVTGPKPKVNTGYNNLEQWQTGLFQQFATGG